MAWRSVKLRNPRFISEIASFCASPGNLLTLPGRRNHPLAAFHAARCVTLGNGFPLAPGALGAVLGGGVFLGAALTGAIVTAAAGPIAVTAAAALYALCSAMLVARAGVFRKAFGLANVLTLTRLVITCALTAFAIQFCITAAAADRVMWMLSVLAAGALVIDGLDGLAARRLGLESSFGARFDMEVDALLILVLSVLACATGKAGVWVIAGGLLRYVYLIAAYGFPALARPLAPAWRRKAIAVIQGATLTALLAPAIQPPLSAALALIALALLIYSFGADIVAQVRGS